MGNFFMIIKRKKEPLIRTIHNMNGINAYDRIAFAVKLGENKDELTTAGYMARHFWPEIAYIDPEKHEKGHLLSGNIRIPGVGSMKVYGVLCYDDSGWKESEKYMTYAINDFHSEKISVAIELPGTGAWDSAHGARPDIYEKILEEAAGYFIVHARDFTKNKK